VGAGGRKEIRKRGIASFTKKIKERVEERGEKAKKLSLPLSLSVFLLQLRL